jgi:hypothetical protein
VNAWTNLTDGETALERVGFIQNVAGYVCFNSVLALNDARDIVRNVPWNVTIELD